MTLPSGGYAAAWEVLRGLVGELTPAEQSAVLAGTAQRTYRLAPTPGGRQVTLRSRRNPTSLT
jgi:hypothetical protein